MAKGCNKIDVNEQIKIIMPPPSPPQNLLFLPFVTLNNTTTTLDVSLLLKDWLNNTRWCVKTFKMLFLIFVYVIHCSELVGREEFNNRILASQLELLVTYCLLTYLLI